MSYCIMKGDQYLTGDLNEGRYKFTTNQELRYTFEDKARAQVIADLEGAQVVREFKEIREFIRDNEDPAPCPYCLKDCHINDGTSVASDEGTYYYCPYCGEASLLIYKGARFIKSSVNPLFPVKVVYEIAADIVLDDLIPCIEIRKINASPLNTVNKTHYQYFGKKAIRHYMSLEFKEDL